MTVVRYKKIIIFGILAIIIFLGTRIYALDQDLPPWGVINYQPVDEGTYVMPAINEYTYGVINPELESEGIQFEVSPHLKTNILGNLSAYIGLKILGDNYYGLRIGSVVCALLVYVLFLLILFKLKKLYAINVKFGNEMIVAFSLYLLVDFSFLMSGRVVETTIYRLLFVQLIILTFLCIKSNWLKAFVLGGLVTFSVFGVYVTNIFLYLSCAFTLFGIWKKEGIKEFFKSMVGAIMGCLVSLAICEFYYIEYWGTYAIKNMIDAISGFSSQAGYEIVSGSWVLLRSTVRFISANVNLYNILLLYMCMIAIPILVKKILFQKDNNILFFCSIIVSYFLQTLFSEDYVVRKFILIYLVMFYLIYILGVSGELNEAWEGIRSKSRQVKILLTLYFIVCAGGCFGIPIFRLFVISNQTYDDFNQLDKIMVLLCVGVVVLVCTFVLLRNIWSKQERKSLPKYTIAISIACIVILNLYLDVNYVFFNKTYTEKQCMIDIGKVADEKFVIGTYFPMGYTLYNDIKPAISTNDNIKVSMEKNGDIYYLDYTYEDVKGYIDSIFTGCNYELESIQEFQRNLKTFGRIRNVELFKKVSVKEGEGK